MAASLTAARRGTLRLITRDELAQCPHWQSAFAGERKDHRYYELLEDTIPEGFTYRYFAIADDRGDIRAIQPFFLVHQDLLAGIASVPSASVETIRRHWPGFLKQRTLMIGCAAGEGHLDGEPSLHGSHAQILAANVLTYARSLKAPLVVLKEFPACYREALKCFLDYGFHRVPSLPMTRRSIAYANFEDYMSKALNSAMRTKLRRKFRAAASAAPIVMTVVNDVSSQIDSIYPLYLQVYRRSKLHFEKLTKEYICALGRRMPDKVRFFVWRQDRSIIAFTMCMVQGDALFAEYIGLDYSVALDLHLYHYAVRDMISWAIAGGYRWFRSSGLNYDPKLHFRHQLDPLDLYVRHTSRMINAGLSRVLPFIEPTHRHPTLRKFANYRDLWASQEGALRHGVHDERRPII